MRVEQQGKEGSSVRVVEFPHEVVRVRVLFYS